MGVLIVQCTHNPTEENCNYIQYRHCLFPFCHNNPKLRGDFSSSICFSGKLFTFSLCPILQPYNGHVLQVHSLTSALCPLQQSRHFCLIALTGVNLAIFYLFLFARRRQQVPTLGYSPKNIVSLRRFRASI